MPSKEVELPTLVGDNYATWKWQLSMILKSRGLDTTLTATSTDQQLDLQAITLIVSTLSEENKLKVIKCNSAKEIWVTLEKNFENKTAVVKQSMMSRFYSYKIKSFADIGKELGEIQGLAAKLETFGTKIDDDTITCVILNSLPLSFDDWKETWSLTNGDKSDINKLITSIMAKASHMKNKEKNAALFVKSKSTNHKTRGKRFSKT